MWVIFKGFSPTCVIFNALVVSISNEEQSLFWYVDAITESKRYRTFAESSRLKIVFLVYVY